MATRTDTHSLKNADYSLYRFVAVFYIGTDDESRFAYRSANDHYRQILDRAIKEGKLFHGPSGGCDHCGAHYAHGVMLQHIDSGEYIRVGHTCGDNFAGYANAKAARVDIDRRIARIKRDNAYKAQSKADREAIYFCNPGLEECLSLDHEILSDIKDRLQTWGKISDKQIALVFKLARDIWTPTQEHDRVPAVTGKSVEISGEVLAVKDVEGYYGLQVKMLVRDDRGFTTWGSVPKAIVSKVERGNRVTFTANVDAARDDETHSYFKRPRKASIIS